MSKKYTSEVDSEWMLVNKSTGNVKNYVHHVRVKTEPFVMMFSHFIDGVGRLGGTDVKVLLCLLVFADGMQGDNGNTFFNGTPLRAFIKEHTGMSLDNTRLNHILSVLCREGFILRVSRGRYMLNPHFFFIGKLDDRKNLISRLDGNKV